MLFATMVFIGVCVVDKQIRNVISDETRMVGMVGRHVRYMDEIFQIADVVFGEDLIVLQAIEDEDVQSDNFGRPHRLVPRTTKLRFRDTEGEPSHIWDEIVFSGRSGLEPKNLN